MVEGNTKDERRGKYSQNRSTTTQIDYLKNVSDHERTEECIRMNIKGIQPLDFLLHSMRMILFQIFIG
jgi:hypothetical protein